MTITQSPYNNNSQRVVVKERLEKLAGIINESANMAQNIVEFSWMIEDKVRARGSYLIPISFRKAVNNREFIWAMWSNWKTKGSCIDPKELREIERRINEPDRN